MTETAILTFKTQTMANEFAVNWARKTFTGHTISNGTENVSVTVYEVDEAKKNWINNYIKELNQCL